MLITIDLEGVLTPEIWLTVAERTGIEGLRATTRDVSDYRALMAYRIELLQRHDVPFSLLTEVVEKLEPLEGAERFLANLRDAGPVVILSDTYEQLAAPLFAALGAPLVLCHRLRIVADRIVGVEIRRPDAKRSAVEAFRQLGYSIVAIGDSFNDVSMFDAADHAMLFRPSEAVRAAHPELTVLTSHDDLLVAVERAREVIEGTTPAD